jgi:hypothetical protein
LPREPAGSCGLRAISGYRHDVKFVNFARPFGSTLLRAVDAQCSFGASFQPTFRNFLAAFDAKAVFALLDAIQRALGGGDLTGDEPALRLQSVIVLHLHGAFGRIRIVRFVQVALNPREATFKLFQLRF